MSPVSAEQLVVNAVKAALDGDATHAALTNGVFVRRPEPPPTPPYTLVGEVTEVGEPTHDKEGWSYTVTVHDWDQRREDDRLHDLRNARDAVLHRATLSVAGFGLTKMRRDFAEIIAEGKADDLIRHQITRYRVEALAT